MLAAAVAASLLATVAQSALQVTVSPTGAYQLTLDGVAWLQSAPIAYAARWNNATKTSAPGGGLTMDAAPTAVSGSDALGAFSGTEISWAGAAFITRFKNYAGINAVVFEQSFPKGMEGTAQTGAAAHNDLATAFPAFGSAHASLKSNLGYVCWHDTMCDSTTGAWTAAGVSAGSIADVGGVVVLFNSSLAAIAISASSNFMTAGLSFAPIVNTSFAGGFGGMLSRIPAGWTHSTIMVGGQGVNNTMFAWGGALLTLGGKKRTAPDADISTKWLSYWTGMCVRVCV